MGTTTAAWEVAVWPILRCRSLLRCWSRSDSSVGFLRHRRAGGRFPTMARRRPDRPTAVAAGEATDSERQQLLLETAFLAGEVPAVWCRQQMAAIAAGTAQHHPSL